MADLLQRLTLAALLAAACAHAADKPFSHALHLKLRLGCTDCHQAVAASASAADNLLPKAEVCARCHKAGEVSVPDSPPKTLLAHFSHAQHLKLGNVAPVIAAAIDHGTYLSPPGNERELLNTKNQCAACHRGMEQSEQVSEALLPRMADCLVCHNDIDPPDSCSFCHAQGAQLTPSSHTKDFLDSHTSGKLGLDKTTCAVCHGRRFKCMGCHI